MTEAKRRFVDYINGAMISSKTSLQIVKDETSCISFDEKSITKLPNGGVFWFRKHKGWPESCRGETVKSRFARGKWDIWQSLLVWGLHHNSTPPIAVFNQTTIASTIITRSQDSLSPWKPLWPQAHRAVCSPGRGHYWLQGELLEKCNLYICSNKQKYVANAIIACHN